jgi:N4-gp56 family major capsid protein
MADAYTSTDPATLGTALVQTAYDRLVEFKLRALPCFRALADKKPGNPAMPGSSIVFQLYNDLSVATTPLTETADVDAVAVPSTSTVSVTLQEYGNAILMTRKLQLISLSNVDEGVANIAAFNMRDSLDSIVAPVLAGGTHVIRYNSAVLKSDMIAAGAGTTGAITTTDIFTSKIPRLAKAKFSTNKVVPRQGELFGAWVHPDVSHDLRAETGTAAWRDPHNFSGAEAIWAGQIGLYEGVYWIESPRLPTATDGASSAKVYRTFFMGQQALAEAVAEEPHIVFGAVVDKLQRFTPMGWYGMLGWSRYREDALIRAETSSSIA